MKINSMINDYYKKYREVIMYLIFGVLTTLVNIVVYYIETHIFGIQYQISNIIAWVLSVTFAFVTNKIFVFKSKNTLFKDKFREFISFYLFRVISLFMDIAVMYIMIDIFSVNDMISKVFSNVLVVIANYIFSKLFIFKSKN